jgi:hypothetical protein
MSWGDLDRWLTEQGFVADDLRDGSDPGDETDDPWADLWLDPAELTAEQRAFLGATAPAFDDEDLSG